MFEYEQLFKVFLVGEANVGKTSLIFRYIEDTFSVDGVSTIGWDFKVTTLLLGDKEIKLQVWDTAGQENLRSVASSYYRSGHGFIVVYDVTNQNSFEQAEYWIGQITQFNAGNSVNILVGNKTDLEDMRVVDYNTAKAFAEKSEMKYYEVSCKNGENVNSTFKELVRDIYNVRCGDLTPSINITKKGSDKHGSGCC